jgi:hypothetical protein
VSSGFHWLDWGECGSVSFASSNEALAVNRERETLQQKDELNWS